MMNWMRFVVFAGLVSLAAIQGVCHGAPGFTQDFEDMLKGAWADGKQREFWDDVQEMKETADSRGLTRLFRQKTIIAEEAFLSCEFAYVNTEELGFVSVLETLAEGLDKTRGGKGFANRLAYIRSLSSERRQQRVEAMRVWQEANNIMAVDRPKGKDADEAKVKEVRDLIEESLSEFKKLDDVEFIAKTLRLRAILYEGLEDYLNAVKDMGDAIDYWVKAGLPRNSADYSYLVDNRRYWIGKGYDPNRPKGGEEAKEKMKERNTTQSFVEGSTKVQAENLKIKHDVKRTKFKTVSFPGSHSFIWWDTFFGEGDGPSPKPAFGLTPWGREIQFVREGADTYVDWDKDGKGDESFRLTAKPTLVEIPQDPKDPKSPKVGFAVATGQQIEQMFSLDLNNAPTTIFTPIRFRSVSYLEGKIAGQSFSLIDDNDTGIFGDVIEIYDGYIDQNAPPPYFGFDGMIIGKGKVAGPFSEVAAIDGVFHKLDFDPNKLTLSAQPLDLDTGKVKIEIKGKLPITHLIISETKKLKGTNFNIADATKDGLDVPVGTYEITVGLVTNGKTSNAYEAVLVTKGNSEPFTVEKDQTVTLKIGAPFRFDFKGESGGGKFKIKGESVRVYGASGECYARFYDDIPIPTVSVRSGGRVIVRGESMRRTSLDDYQEDNTGRIKLYHPLDFETDAAGDGLEARLTLKKHKLLGSKIESDWK